MYYILERVLCSCLNVTVSRKIGKRREPKKVWGGGEAKDTSTTSNCPFFFFFLLFKVTITQVPNVERRNEGFAIRVDLPIATPSQFASIPHT